MNPIEKFYKVKKTYDETKRMAASFDDIYKVDVKGVLADNFNIKIELDDSLFPDVKNDEKWEIYQIISVYIQAHRDEIKAMIIEKLKERMENARETVLKDLDIVEEVKG